MEKVKMVRFEKLKFKNAGPLSYGGARRPGMVMQVFDKIQGPFTARSLEALAATNGVKVACHESVLGTLRRLRKIGLIRVIESLPGGAPVYEKVAPTDVRNSEA